MPFEAPSDARPAAERRASDRFPIQREVRFRLLSKRLHGEAEEGTGTTVNISSTGVLFATEKMLSPGKRIELSINWPAELDNRCQLRLIARGRITRHQDGCAAVEIHQYEFRTAGLIRRMDQQERLAG